MTMSCPRTEKGLAERSQPNRVARGPLHVQDCRGHGHPLAGAASCTDAQHECPCCALSEAPSKGTGLPCGWTARGRWPRDHTAHRGTVYVATPVSAGAGPCRALETYRGRSQRQRAWRRRPVVAFKILSIEVFPCLIERCTLGAPAVSRLNSHVSGYAKGSGSSRASSPAGSVSHTLGWLQSKPAHQKQSPPRVRKGERECF